MKFYTELTQEIMDNILSIELNIDIPNIPSNDVYFYDESNMVEVSQSKEYNHVLTITRMDTFGNSTDIDVIVSIPYVRVTRGEHDDTLQLKSNKDNSTISFNGAEWRGYFKIGELVEVEIL